MAMAMADRHLDRGRAAAPIYPPHQERTMKHVRGVRVQRSRRKGSKLPPGTIYVGRPTMWGNPFATGKHGHAKAVILHRRWLAGTLAALSLERMGYCPAEIDALARLRSRVLAEVAHLAGQSVACWCPPGSKWCHAETLLDLALDAACLEVPSDV
jgi:Domain of unknown function (DUF4326)